MKKFSMYLMVFVAAGSLAFAQSNSSTVNQTGSNDYVDVNQFGSSNSSDIDQYSGDYNVVGTGAAPFSEGVFQSGTSNYNTIYQRGSTNLVQPVASGGYGIQQLGVDNRSYTEQTGTGHVVGAAYMAVDTYDPSTLGPAYTSGVLQRGSENYSSTAQHAGNGNMLSTVMQLGSYNNSYVHQHGSQNYGAAVAVGDRNYSDLHSHGNENKNVVVQGYYASGDDNRSRTVQDGSNNKAENVQGGSRNTYSVNNALIPNFNLPSAVYSIYQNGMNNRGVIQLWDDASDNVTAIRQLGDDHDAQIVSEGGMFNQAVIWQDGGNSNFSYMDVDGDGNGSYNEQHGSNNDAWAYFTGDANTACISQFGEDNYSMVRVTGDNNFAKVLQSGIGNTSDIYVVGDSNYAQVEQLGNTHVSDVDQIGNSNVTYVNQATTLP